MILVDLNVILDVVQNREAHFPASAGVLDEIIHANAIGAVAAHAVTTLYYIVAKYQNRTVANETIDLLLRYFDVIPVGKPELIRARSLNWSDFEDAVVLAAAEAGECSVIITRNVNDFKSTTIATLTPEEYLTSIGD